MRVLLATLVAAFALTSCAAGEVIATPEARSDAEKTRSVIEQADEIVLKKDLISFGDRWEIRIDDKTVATIEGVAFKVYGDTYSILSPKKGLVAGEEEDIFSVARTAHLFDSDQHTTGTLTKEIFSLMARYTLESNDETVATLEQKFSWSLKGVIEDNAGVEAFTLSRKVMAASPELTLTRENNTEVSTVEAILMAVVAAEAYDAENSK